MENAEEVLQLLEEFSKMKPKDIPRELEDYLGYVAKSGDPVYQWSLVKCLFREKLLNVITDFYESTLTIELPPCPNVDPFNYERMKTSLLERLETFSSAPFTIQRICELLTNPRKEYNRADKFMRAIEKNILVVSTREPGSAKRPLECDTQTDTVLNGIPDVKLDSDGSILHVSTDLPLLGAPPASNDVTVETSEMTTTVSDSEEIEVDRPRPTQNTTPESDKIWSKAQIDRPTISVTPVSSEEPISQYSASNEESPKGDNREKSNVPADSSSKPISNTETGTDPILPTNSEDLLPDSIEITEDKSSDFHSYCKNNEVNDSEKPDNEAPSTPLDTISESPVSEVSRELTPELTDSEAETTTLHQVPVSDTEELSEINSLSESDITASDSTLSIEENKSVTISELPITKPEETDLECNEITGTVESPTSPDNNSESENTADQKLDVSEECEQPVLLPDSSNDLFTEDKAPPNIKEPDDSQTSTEEADSMSETTIFEISNKPTLVDSTPELTIENRGTDIVPKVSSPHEDTIHEECAEASDVAPIPVVSHSADEVGISISEPVSCLNTSPSKELTKDMLENCSEISEEMCDQERKEGSIIHSAPSMATEVLQHITTIEEISVDQLSCETEEEAMDVDESSNQMMSEGENEGEPMDQSEQPQS